MRKAWLIYLFGKPERTTKIIIVVGLIAMIATPGLLSSVLNRLFGELAPLMGPAIQLGIVFLAYKFMFGSIFKKGGK